MIMELGRKKVRLGELLVNSGVLTNEQLQQALDNPARQGKKLGEFLVDEGIVSEDDLAKALSKQLDLDMIDLQSINVDKEVLNLVPVNVLKKNKIFPFAYKENNFNVLMVAMADPLDYNAIDDINIITNFQVEPVVATTRSIMLARSNRGTGCLRQREKAGCGGRYRHGGEHQQLPHRNAGQGHDRKGRPPACIRYPYRTYGKYHPCPLPYRRCPL